MLFKLTYSITVIGCSSLLGFIFANTYIERTKLLNALLSTLQMLETEIVYASTPIPALMEKVGSKSKKEIGDILITTANLLGKNQGLTFDEVWFSAVTEGAKHTSFSKEDVDLLLSLGKNLGISNCEDQIKHIRLVQEELKRHYALALIEQSKNVKLFKNLGFLLGITIVILLY